MSRTELEYRFAYGKHDPSRKALFDLALEIHGLDFRRWEAAGYWDPDFVPFSFFQQDRCVATTCIYLLLLRVQGRDLLVPQLSTVATRPEYRRRGLNRELTERALRWAAEQGAVDWQFFYADEEALPFYRKCGFRPAEQLRYLLDMPSFSPGPQARQLDPADEGDLKLLERIGRSRQPVSSRLGAHYSHLLMFHALYTMRDALWLLPGGRVAVMARNRGETLQLLDVIAADLPELSELLAALPIAIGCRRIEFGFAPDAFSGEAVVQPDPGPHGQHLGGADPFASLPVRFPASSQA